MIEMFKILSGKYDIADPNLINSGNTSPLYMILKPKFLEQKVEVGIRN